MRRNNSDSKLGADIARRDRVGKYALGRVLGEGAFGKVRLGVDTSVPGGGREYAIKILKKASIDREGLADQVRREITIMKAMRHRNIVNLLEVLSCPKKIYMVMDVLTGGDLFDAVVSAGCLDEDLARSYFQQLMDGIGYCHSRQIYHRDLKPENLLLSEDQKLLKITDFGLASIQEGDAESELLHAVGGSAHYMAPEILTSAKAGYRGDKADIWACGVILYIMLAGSQPFDAEDTSELYRSIVEDDVDFPVYFSSDVVELLRSMLHKDPDQRPDVHSIKTNPWIKTNYNDPSLISAPQNLDPESSPEKEVVNKKPHQSAIFSPLDGTLRTLMTATEDEDVPKEQTGSDSVLDLSSLATPSGDIRDHGQKLQNDSEPVDVESSLDMPVALNEHQLVDKQKDIGDTAVESSLDIPVGLNEYRLVDKEKNIGDTAFGTTQALARSPRRSRLEKRKLGISRVRKSIARIASSSAPFSSPTGKGGHAMEFRSSNARDKDSMSPKALASSVKNKHAESPRRKVEVLKKTANEEKSQVNVADATSLAKRGAPPQPVNSGNRHIGAVPLNLLFAENPVSDDAFTDLDTQETDEILLDRGHYRTGHEQQDKPERPLRSNPPALESLSERRQSMRAPYNFRRLKVLTRQILSPVSVANSRRANEQKHSVWG